MRLLIHLVAVLAWCGISLYLVTHDLLTRLGAAVLLVLGLSLLFTFLRAGTRQAATTSWIPIRNEDAEDECEERPVRMAA